MNKNKTEIMVRTQAEGYVLEVGQKGYLYDSAGQLVEGLIYHVLLNGKSHRRGREVSKMLRTFTDKTKVELQREVVALKERRSRCGGFRRDYRRTKHQMSVEVEA